MLPETLCRFPRIWCVDFEFYSPDGEQPTVRCMVALELRTGKIIRWWASSGGLECPFEPGDLIVAYYASAEMGCFKALGWLEPNNLLDLYPEVRILTNGINVPGIGRVASLLSALSYFGLRKMEYEEKASLRELIMEDRGNNTYSKAERKAILDYCEADVLALRDLLSVLQSKIFRAPGDLDRALLRGRYSIAVAAMESNGIPIDTDTLRQLKKEWDTIKVRLISAVDPGFRVYVDGSFNMKLFAAYLERSDIPWPLLESGRLDLKDETFRQMAKTYPAIQPLHELRYTLSKLKLNSLSVGKDGRNRYLLSMYGAKTGRNTPSNSKSVFGPGRWIRGLIKPEFGTGIAYIDWGSQEVAIAAALSSDRRLVEAYESGDVYLAFAKQAGLAPKNATKQSHKQARDQCKAAVLGIQYGMGEHSLALRINQPTIAARQLLQSHQEAYPTFWKWSQAVVDHAVLYSYLETVFGWRVHVEAANPRSLRNFPMQANGAEMLRLACIMAHEAGIKILAPIHDAILIESSLETLNDDIQRTQEVMQQAAKIVIGDALTIRTDVDKITYPDRYMDEGGKGMWNTITGLLEQPTGDTE